MGDRHVCPAQDQPSKLFQGLESAGQDTGEEGAVKRGDLTLLGGSP